MSQADRVIQVGDLVRIHDDQGQFGDYLIKAIQGLVINIHPLDDPELISTIIITPQGPVVEGAEDQAFEFEFSIPEPSKLSVAQAFSINIDSSNWYQPLTPLRQVTFRTVKDWLDSPAVRLNLFQHNQLVVIAFPFSSGRYSQQVQVNFNSPYRESYQDYILSQLLAQYINAENNSLDSDRIESKLAEELIFAGLGALSIKPKDIYHIFGSIFPQLSIQVVPDNGDCYYTSVGLSKERSSEQVRADLAMAFTRMTPSDQQGLVREALGSCSDSTSLGQQYRRQFNQVLTDFPQLLRTSCGEGRRDCDGCIWGGNFLDELVYLSYQLPIVSVGVISTSQPNLVKEIRKLPESTRLVLELVLNQITPSFWQARRGLLSIPLDETTLSINVHPLLFGSDERRVMESPGFIGYLALGEKHVDGIISHQ